MGNMLPAAPEINEDAPSPIQKDHAMATRIILHADGACSGNPGPGGWAATLRIEEEGAARTWLLTGGDPATTNNIMELEAAESALRHVRDVFRDEAAGAEIILRLDSEYVLKGLGEWIPGWKKRDWRKADGKPVANIDLWQRLDRLQIEVKALGTLKLVHVRGHSGDPENELVDREAVKARDQSRTAQARWTGQMQDLSTLVPTEDPAAAFVEDAKAKGYSTFKDIAFSRHTTYLTSVQKRVLEGDDTLFFVNVGLWSAPAGAAVPLMAEAGLQFNTQDNGAGKPVSISFPVESVEEAEQMAREIWTRMGFGRYETGPDTAPSP